MSHTAKDAILQDLMDAGQASATELMRESSYCRDDVNTALLNLRIQGLARYVNTRRANGALLRLHSLTPAGIEAALATTQPTKKPTPSSKP